MRENICVVYEGLTVPENLPCVCMHGCVCENVCEGGCKCTGKSVCV